MSQVDKKEPKLISRKLKEFIENIKYVDRNPKNVDALEELKNVSTNPCTNINRGTHFYRSRLVTDDKSNIGIELMFEGYSMKYSFVPPVNKSKDSRASYRFIPYLYVASTEKVSIAEVRPKAEDEVSVAIIEVMENLTLFDLIQVKTVDEKRNVKDNILIDLAELYSKPVSTEDEQIDYVPTQYIAEFIKKCDYDGIIYPSSFFPDEKQNYNIVIFNYDKCRAVRSYLKIPERIDSCSH